MRRSNRLRVGLFAIYATGTCGYPVTWSACQSNWNPRTSHIRCHCMSGLTTVTSSFLRTFPCRSIADSCG